MFSSFFSLNQISSEEFARVSSLLTRQWPWMESFRMCEWMSLFVFVWTIHGKYIVTHQIHLTTHLIWDLWRAIKENLFCCYSEKSRTKHIVFSQFYLFLRLDSFNVQKIFNWNELWAECPFVMLYIQWYTSLCSIDRENLKNLLHNGEEKTHGKRIMSVVLIFFLGSFVFHLNCLQSFSVWVCVCSIACGY